MAKQRAKQNGELKIAPLRLAVAIQALAWVTALSFAWGKFDLLWPGTLGFGSERFQPFLGVLMANVGLLSVWMALGPSPGWLRWPAGTLGVLTLGALAHPNEDMALRTYGPAFALGESMLLLAALWPLRWLGLRITNGHRDDADGFRFSLVTLICWMLAAGVLLSIGRTAIRYEFPLAHIAGFVAHYYSNILVSMLPPALIVAANLAGALARSPKIRVPCALLALPVVAAGTQLDLCAQWWPGWFGYFSGASLTWSVPALLTTWLLSLGGCWMARIGGFRLRRLSACRAALP